MSVLTSTKFPVSIIDSALSIAAAGLSAGDWATFTKNTTQQSDDIKWMTKPLYYDAIHRELQYVGKPASGSSKKYTHYIYDEATDIWTNKGSFVSEFGHNWTNAIDLLNGDHFLYTDKGGSGLDFIWHYNYSADSWSTIPLTVINIGAMAYHPNLFGAGIPGLFVWEGDRFYARHLANETWSDLGATGGTGTPYGRMANGTGDYLPSIDACICGSTGRESGSDRHPILKIDAGAGNSSDAISEGTITYMGDSPVKIHGSPHSSQHGKLIAHPSDPSRVMILEGSAAASRVWTSPNGDNWNQKSYTHPFFGMPTASGEAFMIGRVSEYGIIIAMSSDGAGGETRIWKPDD